MVSTKKLSTFGKVVIACLLILSIYLIILGLRMSNPTVAKYTSLFDFMFNPIQLRLSQFIVGSPDIASLTGLGITGTLGSIAVGAFGKIVNGKITDNKELITTKAQTLENTLNTKFSGFTSSLTSKFNEAKAEVTGFKDTMNDRMDGEFQSFKAQLTTYQQDFTNYKVDAQKQMDTLNAENSDFLSKLTDANKTIQQKDIDLATLKDSSSNSIKDVVSQYDSKIVDLNLSHQQELDKIQADTQLLLNQTVQEVVAKDDTINQLQQKLEALKNQSDSASKAYKSLSNQLLEAQNNLRSR